MIRQLAVAVAVATRALSSLAARTGSAAGGPMLHAVKITSGRSGGSNRTRAQHPAGLPTGLYPALLAAEERSSSPLYRDRALDGALVARNPAFHFVLRFDRNGVVITPAHGHVPPSISLLVLGAGTNGRFSLYAPGYSAPLPLSGNHGIFVLNGSGASRAWMSIGTLYTSSPQASVPLTADWNLLAEPYPFSPELTASALADQIDSTCQTSTTCNVTEIAVTGTRGYQTWQPSQQDMSIPATSGFWVELSTGATWAP